MAKTREIAELQSVLEARLKAQEAESEKSVEAESEKPVEVETKKLEETKVEKPEAELEETKVEKLEEKETEPVKPAQAEETKPAKPEAKSDEAKPTKPGEAKPSKPMQADKAEPDKQVSRRPTSVLPKPAPVIAFRHDGPGKAYKYWSYRDRCYKLSPDIWVAQMFGQDAWEPVWVWYRDGKINHLLSEKECEELLPN